MHNNEQTDKGWVPCQEVNVAAFISGPQTQQNHDYYKHPLQWQLIGQAKYSHF